MRVYIWVLRRASQIVTKYELGVSSLHISAYCLLHKDDVQPMMSQHYWSNIGRLLDTFHSAREHGLTDPRDRVYAFYELPTSDHSAGLQLVPDYHKSFLDVCRDFALSYLRACKSLDLLLYVSHDEETLASTFASWIPRWSFDTYPRQDLESTYAKRAPLNSTGSLEIPLVTSEDRLQVWAMRFAQVEYVGKVFQRDTMNLDLIAKLWSEVSRLNHPQSVAKSSRLSMFLMTLAGGIIGLDERKHLQNVAACLLELCKRSGEDVPDQSQHWKSQAERGDAEEYVKWVWVMSPNRRFMVTEKGYALGPLAAQIGDECSIIRDGKCPFILRKAEQMSCFKLVGTAFHSSEVEFEHEETGLSFPIGLDYGMDWTSWGFEEEKIQLV